MPTDNTAIAKALQKFALGLPDVTQGIACEGTAAEKTTVKIRNKAFMFLSAKDIMVRLNDSLQEANLRSATSNGAIKVGATGWVTIKFGESAPPLNVLKRWLDESYKLAGIVKKGKSGG